MEAQPLGRACQDMEVATAFFCKAHGAPSMQDALHKTLSLRAPERQSPNLAVPQGPEKCIYYKYSIDKEYTPTVPSNH